MIQKPNKPPATLNLIERSIAAVSPKWGFRRLQHKTALALAGGYHGASLNRAATRGWKPAETSSNDDTLGDLPLLRARSRDLARNAPLAGAALNTSVTNVVGTGLSMQSRIDAEALDIDPETAAAWQRSTEREWRLWCESTDCDATRTQNFYGVQALAFRSVCESGDLLAILAGIRREQSPYELAIQLIEADRLSNPDYKQDSDRLAGGVELDSAGAAIRYHVANRHPGARNNGKGIKWSAIEARANSGRINAIHLFDRTRPGQVRGIPMLAPVIEPLKQLGRYTDAELQAAVISAAFAVFVKMDPEAFGEMFDDAGRQKYIDSSIKWDGSLTNASFDDPGKAVNLLPGESIETANPGRPNAEFDPFVQAITSQIGAALQIPSEVLIKHFNSSYSASRAALLDAWRFFRGRRDWLATHFCQPIYDLWLEEAISLGRVRAPGYFTDPARRRAWSGAQWVGDGPGSIDPEKEVKAAEKRIALGISTRSAESILHDGGDWESKHQQLATERAKRIAAGLDQDATAPEPSTPQPDPNNNAMALAMTGINASFTALANADRPVQAAPQITINQPERRPVVRVPVRDENGIIVALHEVDELREDDDED
jgi:lambda family phage portal protein